MCCHVERFAHCFSSLVCEVIVSAIESLCLELTNEVHCDAKHVLKLYRFLRYFRPPVSVLILKSIFWHKFAIN